MFDARGVVEVLVVDDEPAIRETICMLVEAAGYRALEAPDGMSALTRLRVNPRPLVVLLDWMMPGMDGLAVLRAIAADATVAKRHAFIFMSAASDRFGRVPQKVLALMPPSIPVVALGKPFKIDALMQAVEQAAAGIATV